MNLFRKANLIRFNALAWAVLLASVSAQADPNYHLVGWLNTFIPGAGEIALGNPVLGVGQAAGEVGAFAWGYSISARSPMTLDGVPEAIPRFNRTTRRVQQDITGPLYADWLQEIGIKAHMTNTFNAYRDAAARTSTLERENIDSKSTLDLFLAPFDSKVLSDPWVYWGIAVGFLGVAVDYYSTVHSGLTRLPRFTPYSNSLYAATYGGLYPFGSAVPEEMFYRGFLQNEFQHLVPSPFFSILASSTLFALSHEAGIDQLSAGVSGIYFGYLTFRGNGRLSSGICVHFWTDVITGIESIALSQLSQHTTPPTAFMVQINY